MLVTPRNVVIRELRCVKSQRFMCALWNKLIKFTSSEKVIFACAPLFKHDSTLKPRHIFQMNLAYEISIHICPEIFNLVCVRPHKF
jgi:hypothetical protein